VPPSRPGYRDRHRDTRANALEDGLRLARAGPVGQSPVPGPFGDPRAAVQLRVDELLADLAFDGVSGRGLDQRLDNSSDDCVDPVERLELVLSRAELPLALDAFGDIPRQPDDGVPALNPFIDRDDASLELSAAVGRVRLVLDRLDVVGSDRPIDTLL